MISPEQEQLFNLMVDFTVETVLGWVSCIYKKFGPTVVAGDAFASIIIPFAQDYFNCVARWIYDRSDNYVNEKFDAMTAIKLAGKNDPADVLHMIVMLCMNAIHDMDIRDVVSDNYHTSMGAIKVHLRAIINRHSGAAEHFLGCTQDHYHAPVGPNDRVFTFAVDKYTELDGRMVKLSTLDI